MSCDNNDWTYELTNHVNKAKTNILLLLNILQIETILKKNQNEPVQGNSWTNPNIPMDINCNKQIGAKISYVLE